MRAAFLRQVCPVVIALVDRASRKTVGYAVGKSENADAIEASIVNACESHGHPICIKFDNAAALNSKRIASGRHPVLPAQTDAHADWKVPVVLSILQIGLTNTGVGAHTSNIQENVWSHLRRVDNHPLFHRAQRPGPNDPEVAQGAPVPIDLFEKGFDKAVVELNAATGNRVAEKKGSVQ